jgi:peptidoglycan/LPS O-acetylase OafA/YrhL
MNGLLLTGTIIVFFALGSYSIAIITEQRKKLILKRVLIFLTLGVLFDITATTFMILGSTKGFTFHGFLGYTSLAGMFADAVLIWRLRLKKGLDSPVPKKLHLYSRYAYAWWVLAFITGGLLVAFRN